MAYPNPEKARLHNAPIVMKTTTPSGPVSKRTPTMNPTMTIGMINALATVMSAAMCPSRIARRRMGVSSRRSK